MPSAAAVKRHVVRLDPEIWRNDVFAYEMSMITRFAWFDSLFYLAAEADSTAIYPHGELVRSLGPEALHVGARLVELGLWEDVGLGYLIHPHCGCAVAAERRVPFPDAVRALVYARDGHACVACGSSAALSLDHIFPWSLGGSDGPENLQTLCRSCNSRKGARI